MNLSRQKTSLGGQDYMSLKELESAYDESVKEENQRLQSTLLSSILDKEIKDSEKRLDYFMKKIDLLIEIGAYSDAYHLIQEYFDQRANYHRTDTDDLRFEAQCGQIIMLKGDIWNGYLIILKAISQLLKFKIYFKPNNIPKHKLPSQEQKNLMETNIKKIDQIGDWAKQFVQLLKKGVDFTVVEGQQEQYCGVGNRINSVPITSQPELKNRIVKQIACGSNHVLVLTECLTNHQTFFKNTKIGLDYDHLIQPQCNVVFGWGENINGQVLGDPALGGNIIYYPTILSQLMNINIKGIQAKERISGAFDDQGIIYSWGSEGDPCLQIEPESFQKIISNDIQDLQRGDNYTSILNEKKELFVWGRINCIKKQDIVFHSIKAPGKIELPEGVEIQNHYSGDNHMIIIDQNNKVWGYGDNSKNQIGINSTSKNVYQADKFVLIEDEFLQEQEQIIKCVLGHTCTFYLCESGNAYYTGYISDHLQSKEPHKIMFQEGGVKVKDLYIHNSDIIVLSDRGIAYVCHSSHQSIFNTLKTTYQMKFNQVYFNKYCKIFERTVLDLENCSVEKLINNTFQSLQEIKLNFKLTDKSHIKGYNMFYPFRVYFFVYQQNKGHGLSEPELQNKAKLKFIEEYDNIVEQEIYLYELSEEGQVENAKIKVSQNEIEKVDQINLNFKIKSCGNYEMFIWLNEFLITNDPIQLVIKQSQEEKERIVQVKNRIKLTQKQIDELEIEIFLASSQIQTKKDKLYALNKEKKQNLKKIEGSVEKEKEETEEKLNYRNLEIDKEIEDLQQKIDNQQETLDFLKEKLNNPQPEYFPNNNNNQTKIRSQPQQNNNNSMNKSGGSGYKVKPNRSDSNPKQITRRRTQDLISEFDQDSQNTSMNRSRNNMNRSLASQKRKVSQPVSSSGKKSSILMLKETLMNNQKELLNEIENEVQDEVVSDILLKSFNSKASKGSSDRDLLDLQEKNQELDVIIEELQKKK